MSKFPWLRPAGAIAASFTIYLLPVFTVHISIPWGVVLGMEVFRLAGDREILWLIMDLGFALMLQAAAGGLVYWAIGGWRWWRAFILIAAIPGFFWVLQVGYQIAIPTLFLIEAEEQGDHGEWAVACTVPDAEVAQLNAGPTQAMERASEAWLRTPSSEYSLLTMPDCRVDGLPVAISRTVLKQVVPGGGGLFYVSGMDGTTTHYILAPGGSPQTLKRPTGVEYWTPVLSSDATSVAWIVQERTNDKIGTKWGIRLREIESGAERTVALKIDRPASYELIAVDGAGNQFTATRNGSEIVSINGQGVITHEPLAPNPATQPTQYYRRLQGGWVSWEIYRDDNARHRVVWSLPAGQGLHEVLKGRGIRAASISPDGRLIAISVGPNTRIGSVKDSLYVLRASDGAEVFRRVLPPYSRSVPAFLGNDHLAITLPRGATVDVRVLEIPSGIR